MRSTCQHIARSIIADRQTDATLRAIANFATVDYRLSGVVTDGGRGGHPERHVSKGRHIEVHALVHHSVYKNGTKKVQKIIHAYFVSLSQLK